MGAGVGEGSRFVVVGAGLAGSATALELARRGHETTIVERTVPAAPDGSSHGSARIFRYAYDDPFWVRLVQRSRAGYAELERLTGQRLLTPTGALDHGALRGARHLAGVLEGCGVEHELLTSDRAGGRWPGVIADDGDGDVLWHPGAGVLDAEAVVLAQVALAERHGARVLRDWPVASVERRAAHATGFRLTTPDGRALEAEHVVVAAGGWLPQLLPRLPLPAAFAAALPRFSVSQEQAFQFPYRGGWGGGDDADGAWPTTIHHRRDLLVYSLPGGRDAGGAGQKVAQMHGGRAIASAAEQDGVVDPAARERLVRHVAEHLPGLVPEPFAETTCLFTNTPDDDFVIDAVQGITVVSACSGHGAKFAPVVGELAADAATGRGPLERFAVRPV